MIRGEPDAVLYVMGVPVDIYADEDLDATGRLDVYGICHIGPEEQYIRVNSQLTGRLLARSLVHEAAHAIFRLAGPSGMFQTGDALDEEQVIMPFELALPEIFRDDRNEWFVNILLGGDAPWQESTEPNCKPD